MTRGGFREDARPSGRGSAVSPSDGSSRRCGVSAAAFDSTADASSVPVRAATWICGFGTLVGSGAATIGARPGAGGLVGRGGITSSPVVSMVTAMGPRSLRRRFARGRTIPNNTATAIATAGRSKRTRRSDLLKILSQEIHYALSCAKCDTPWERDWGRRDPRGPEAGCSPANMMHGAPGTE